MNLKEIQDLHQNKQKQSRNQDILDVFIWPNSVLSCIAKIVPLDGIENRREFAKQLLITMQYYNGLGLAAPQVGINERIIAVTITNESPIVMFNPKILEFSQAKETVEEGCLSFPNILLQIQRYKEIKVSYYNQFGQLETRMFQDLNAKVIQHEIEHLNGTTFLSHLSRIKRDIIVRKFKKQARILKKLSIIYRKQRHEVTEKE